MQNELRFPRDFDLVASLLIADKDGFLPPFEVDEEDWLPPLLLCFAFPLEEEFLAFGINIDLALISSLSSSLEEFGEFIDL